MSNLSDQQVEDTLLSSKWEELTLSTIQPRRFTGWTSASATIINCRQKSLASPPNLLPTRSISGREAETPDRTWRQSLGAWRLGPLSSCNTGSRETSSSNYPSGP